MKHFASVVLVSALAISLHAQDAKNTAATNQAAAEMAAPIASFSAAVAVLSAPLILTNDFIYLPGDQVEVTNGGKAVFNFTVTNEGSFVIEALVNAPDESSNSFYLNIDAQPEDPEMIWDIEITSGFEKRMVGWRGNGDSAADEFASKYFKLTAGKHDLIIVGREPGVQLKSLSIRPAPPQ